MTWRRIEPLVAWGNTVDRVCGRHTLPPLDGSLIYVASDYSGTHLAAHFNAISVIYCDIEASREWLAIQRGFRKQFLSDGRRMSFKRLGDRLRRFSLVPFLKGADAISGLLVSLVVDRRLLQIAGGRAARDNPRFAEIFRGSWKPELFESMSRVTHLIGLMIGGLAKPGQSIYWVSDDDPLFATSEPQEDLVRFLSLLIDTYVPFDLGNLGVATTAIDNGDRFEEDLAAIPNLAAGALVDGLSALRNRLGRGLPLEIALPIDLPFSAKSETIWDWLWDETGNLSKLCFLVQQADDGGFSVSRFRAA
jgi:hypothetical protein